MVRTATNRNLFEQDTLSDALLSAPNPKPSKKDKEGFGRLASLYTAFSTDFARFALELCLSAGHRRIADPFAGMGTLGEAGRGMPVQLLLNDLNPFAVTSCCLRTARSQDIRSAVDQIRSISFLEEDEPEEARFAHAIDELLPAGKTVRTCLDTLKNAASHQAMLGVHLLALVRIAMHRRLKGSNPTWTKRSTPSHIGRQDFAVALRSVLAHATAYAAQVEPLSRNFAASFTCRDVADLSFEAGSLDAIVTSPPYPNRTDYIRHYLPAAELLLGGDPVSERRLREAQIGTPLIRAELTAAPLPMSVRTIIERVRLHKSYASERYYAKGFVYYFTDIQRALERFANWLARDGTLILVVQDTYYKEVLIPVADLMCDIAETCGLALRSRQDFRVRHPLSRLSPHSRASMPKRQHHETALMFGRANR